MDNIKNELLKTLQNFSEENGIYLFGKIAESTFDMENCDDIEFSCNPYPDDEEGLAEREKAIQEPDNDTYYNDILFMYLTCPDYEEDF